MKLRTQDILRQGANLLFAVTQIVVGYGFSAAQVGTSVNIQSAAAQSPVTPAGYAFSIWGLIFGLALVYAVWQLFPKQRDNPLLRRVGILTALAFFFNTVWEVVAQLVTFSWPTVVIIILICLSSVVAVRRLANERGMTKTERILVWGTMSLLAGWVTAATFANIAAVMSQFGYPWYSVDGTLMSVLLLALASIMTVGILSKIKGNWVYGCAVLWAFVAIMAANLTRAPNIVIAWCTALLLIPIIWIMVDHGHLRPRR